MDIYFKITVEQENFISVFVFVNKGVINELKTLHVINKTRR